MVPKSKLTASGSNQDLIYVRHLKKKLFNLTTHGGLGFVRQVDGFQFGIRQVKAYCEVDLPCIAY